MTGHCEQDVNQPHHYDQRNQDLAYLLDRLWWVCVVKNPPKQPRYEAADHQLNERPKQGLCAEYHSFTSARDAWSLAAAASTTTLAVPVLAASRRSILR